MASQKHVHKYYRDYLGAHKVWMCGYDNCSHHMPNHMVKTIINGPTICWVCEGVASLHPLNMTIDRPICESCRYGSDEPDIPLSPAMRARLSATQDSEKEPESDPSESIRAFIKRIN